ncbi:MAG: hypothetical protein ACRYGA_04250 [Janthinobacterium lividum]
MTSVPSARCRSKGFRGRGMPRIWTAPRPVASLRPMHESITACISKISSASSTGTYLTKSSRSFSVRTRLASSSIRKASRTGVHCVADSVADLLPVLDDIGNRLARGERP